MICSPLRSISCLSFSWRATKIIISIAYRLLIVTSFYQKLASLKPAWQKIQLSFLWTICWPKAIWWQNKYCSCSTFFQRSSFRVKWLKTKVVPMRNKRQRKKYKPKLTHHDSAVEPAVKVCGLFRWCTKIVLEANTVNTSVCKRTMSLLFGKYPLLVSMQCVKAMGNKTNLYCNALRKLADKVYVANILVGTFNQFSKCVFILSFYIVFMHVVILLSTRKIPTHIAKCCNKNKTGNLKIFSLMNCRAGLA